MKKYFIWMICVYILCFQIVASAKMADTPYPKDRIDLRNTGLSSFGVTPTGSSSIPKTNWMFKTGLNGGTTAPVIYTNGSILLSGTDGRLYCISQDGLTNWRTSAVFLGNSTPTVASNGKIYVTSAGGFLYCLNSDGSISWQSSVVLSFSTPVIRNDNSICVAGVAPTMAAGCLYCFNPDGSTNWISVFDNISFSTPAIDDNGRIYVGTMSGDFYCFNEDGSTNWNIPIPGVMGSPAIGVNGRIYFGSLDNYIYCINTNGTTNWRILTENTIESSPAIDLDNNIYIGSCDGYLYCCSESGTVLWRSRTDDCIYTSPIIGSDNKIYVGSDDYYFYCFNSDGTTNWKIMTGSYITAPAAINSNGHIYIIPEDEDNLYSISVSNIAAPPSPPDEDDDDEAQLDEEDDSLHLVAEQEGEKDVIVIKNKIFTSKNEYVGFFCKKNSQISIYSFDGREVCHFNVSANQTAQWPREGIPVPGIYIASIEIDGRNDIIQRYIVVLR